MSQVARLSLATAALLGSAASLLAAAYTMTEAFPAFVCSGAFAWIGGIQVLNSLAPHMRPSHARVVHWAYAMTHEFFALLSIGFLRFARLPRTVAGKGKPVLLVHGYINHSSVWMLQKIKLEKAGIGPIYTINLGHPFKSIREYAEKVKLKAEAIAKETGHKELVLVGHSMGGLVSAWYATHLAPPESVTDVITLASPFEGTPMAYMALGPNAREMRRNSEFLQQLKAAMANHPQIRFHHIATKSDHLVIPGHTAAITNNPHFIYEDIGHGSLLYSTRVTDQICEWIKR